MIINQSVKVYSIAVLLLYCTTATAWKDHGEIKVMTQNQYLGADLAPLLTANSGQFNNVLVAILQKVAASRFHDRVQRLAAQIAKEHPDVVALQEVWRLDCQDWNSSASKQEGCNDPMIKGAFVDQLQETLSALKAQGLKYRAVASVKNLDVSLIHIDNLPAGIPFLFKGFPAILNTIDRDVILVRDGIPARPVDFKKVCPNRISLNGCNYQDVIPALTPVGSLPILRGFVVADVKVKGKVYRIANTHLELREPDPTNPLSRFYQAAQATELIKTLQATTPRSKSLILLGDMNSSPEDKEIAGIIPPYLQFVDAGYTDGWTLRSRLTPGYTCCQAEELLNKKSELFERIDYIFSKQDTWGEHIRLVGIRQSEKTLPPAARLWPSDHAGLVGELHFWE
jgi:endonuclease/exonuclease/phosphatase family metal-dependent hydrolase